MSRRTGRGRICCSCSRGWIVALALLLMPRPGSTTVQQVGDLATERREYSVWLATAPLSPYALLRIQPVDQGISIGAEPADIPLPGIGRGMAREENRSIVFRRDSGALVLPRGRPVTIGRFTLVASGPPGRGIIAAFGAVRNAKPPTWYSPAPAFDLSVALQPSARRDPFRILGPDGMEIEVHEAGTVQAPVGGTTTQLRVYRIPGDAADESELLIYFRDGTSGKGSYPAGRFVTLLPITGGRFRLDFNRSRNPFCAYSSAFPCPAPWPGNTLPVPVEAGEQYHGIE